MTSENQIHMMEMQPFLRYSLRPWPTGKVPVLTEWAEGKYIGPVDGKKCTHNELTDLCVENSDRNLA